MTNIFDVHIVFSRVVDHFYTNCGPFSQIIESFTTKTRIIMEGKERTTLPPGPLSWNDQN